MKIVYRRDNYNDEVCPEFLYKSTRQLNIKSMLIDSRYAERTHRYISYHFPLLKISFHSNEVAYVDSTNDKHVILSCRRQSSLTVYKEDLDANEHFEHLYVLVAFF